MLRMELLLRLLCLCACVGAYLCSSGLLRLNEVFFQGATSPHAPELLRDAPLHGPSEPDKAYDRLVVVLIDALRADMVLGSAAMRSDDINTAGQTAKGELNAHMPFTSGLVASGQALGYVAQASVPTVTMPRLKALVTGKAPAFIDILKNFNSAALGDDANLVALLAASGHRIVFYGDDTWLKLFPSAFQRTDGTSGFYTRDTVEVDDNVTRHLHEELDPTMENEKSSDWDALVLHYLGLDHVGHLRGPRSSLMRNKLQEMDSVVQFVVDSVRQQDTRRIARNNTARPSLILLCSDHGMSEVGNHGGATLEESSALLMFLRGDGQPMRVEGSQMYRQKRSQVDLVPTISSLFGLTIPPYSTGLLLQDVVRASSSSSRSQGRFYLRALYRNFQQLYILAKIKFHSSALATFDQQYSEPLRQLHAELTVEEEGEDGAQLEDNVAAAVLQACETLQGMVAQSDGSEYNTPAIFAGLALLVVSIAGAVWLFASQDKQTPFRFNSDITPQHTGIRHHSILLTDVLCVGSILQIASLSSSSSIENEHATAFFFTTSLLFAFGIQLLCKRTLTNSSPKLVLIAALLVITRMLRGRNQIINFGRLNGVQVDTNAPGNEFADDDSVSILSTGPLFPPHILPSSVCLALIGGVMLWKVVCRSHSGPTRAVMPSVIAVSSGLLFVGGMMANLRVKELLSMSSDHGEHPSALVAWMTLDTDGSARVVYTAAALLIVLASLAREKLRLTIVEMVVWLLVALLQRDCHLPTLALLCLQLTGATLLLESEGMLFRGKGIVLAGLALWLSQAAFFALGNSHLVTTIDISQSYHGLSTYSQGLVGFLTFVSVFSGPLLCFVSLLQWLSMDSPLEKLATTSAPASTGSDSTRRTVCLVLVIYQTLRFAVYTVVVYCMRFHLFIWSVFAPKMLYEVAHLVVVLALAGTLASPNGRSSANSFRR